MKTLIRTKNQNFWRNTFERLRYAAKMFRSKLVEKGKSFQQLPKEAPH
jgi:hypothetical protein